MPFHEEESPRKRGVRTGLVMVGVAIVLSPLVSVFGMLLPSRENTIVDELPAMLLSIALVALAITGMANVVYSLIAHRPRQPRVRPGDEINQLGYPRVDNFESHRIVDRAHKARSTFDTPI